MPSQAVTVVGVHFTSVQWLMSDFRESFPSSFTLVLNLITVPMFLQLVWWRLSIIHNRVYCFYRKFEDIYIYIYIYMCTHVSFCTYMCVCVCVVGYFSLCLCLCLSLSIYIYICVCVCVCVYTHARQYVRVCTWICVYSSIFLCMLICVRAYLCVFACIYIYIYIYMYISRTLFEFIPKFTQFVYLSFIFNDYTIYVYIV